MLPIDIVNKLNFIYPELTRAFGDANTFVNRLYDIYPNTIIPAILNLLNGSINIRIIDHLNIRFTLYDLYDSLDINGLVFEEPYSVYSFEGDLLYQVAYHNGVFGNSILDRALLLDTKSPSLFYLEYTTYTGKSSILLIKGLDTPNESKDIGLISQSSTTLIEQEQNNIIQLTLISGQRDMTKPGLPYYPINLYYLPTTSLNILSKQVIINSSLSSISQFDPQVSTSFTFNPTSSGWITLTQNSTSSSYPLNINNISGTGIQRLIPVSANLYYLALDSDINLNLIRNAFNLTDTITTSNFNSYSNINLNGQLSI